MNASKILTASTAVELETKVNEFIQTLDPMENVYPTTYLPHNGVDGYVAIIEYRNYQ